MTDPIDAARERARRERAERARPVITHTSETNRQGAALVRAALAKTKHTNPSTEESND